MQERARIEMKRVRTSKRIAALVVAALAMMVAISTPAWAQGERGHGGGAMERHGFEGHHFGGHESDGRHFGSRDFDRHRFEGGYGFGPVYPYYPPDYTPYAVPPSYWYYCSSSGAYYPSVSSCPEPWVTVPAG
jgi:hypothetical protein